MTGWIAAGVMLAAAVAVVLLARWRSARLIRRLDAMLTAAMEGDFSETSFDESRLSALESRMARYLAASTLSARNLQTQKDQISALISDISHQTRTPVANLQLYAQLLEEQPLTPQGQRCAQAIAAQSEKLQTLMEALVKSSRLETGLLTLHPEPGQLAPMVERAAAQYVPKAQAKQIRLTVGRTDGGALFDPKWTEEALCNLLDNAVKYTPDGGEVTVEVPVPMNGSRRYRSGIPAPASRRRNRPTFSAGFTGLRGRIRPKDWELASISPGRLPPGKGAMSGSKVSPVRAAPLSHSGKVLERFM